MTVVEQRLARTLASRHCPHVAALIQCVEDLPAVLMFFYSLGAARNGWLVQGSLPGMAQEDRQKLAAAGLDVDALEAAGRLSIVELDLTLAPEAWAESWSELLEERLSSGFEAIWFARFPIAPNDADIAAVLPFEEAWMSRFRGRPMVTLCPYIVGAEGRLVSREDRVAAAHDSVMSAIA